jgi:hypothetical protein
MKDYIGVTDNDWVKHPANPPQRQRIKITVDKSSRRTAGKP